VALAGIVCLGVPGCGGRRELGDITSSSSLKVGLSPTSTRVVFTAYGTGAAVPRTCFAQFRALKDKRFATSDTEDHVAVFNLRLQLERPRAESTAGSTARPGEQLVISVATHESRASSPGRGCSVRYKTPGNKLSCTSSARFPTHGFRFTEPLSTLAVGRLVC
jgi:hypothetical protein